MNAQATLEVFIFNDINGDGSEEGLGISGLEFDLILFEDTNGNGNADGGEELPLSSESGGLYTFDNITVTGNEFILRLNDQSPNYFVTTVAPSGAPLGTDGDNDLDFSNWETDAFTLVDGTTESNVDIGLLIPSTIGDFVWEDTNGNGILDGGEPGIDWVAEGININLTAASGNTIDLTGNPFTAVAVGGVGGYEFQNLPPDTYTVEFTDVAGTWFRTINTGDSAPDQGSGITSTINIQSGDMSLDIDAGYIRPASIGDLVWEDFNGNGTFDGTDAGFDWVSAGININLTAASGNTNDLTGAAFTAIDLGGGGYAFQNLPPDTYTVEFTQIANSWYRTQAGLNSTPDQATGFTASFLLESGIMNTDQDAGFVQPITIGDLVWEDFNGNGIFDGADAGFDWVAEGIIINLTAASGNTTNLDGTPFTAIDLGAGGYEFQNLAPDTYTVEFEQLVDNWYRTIGGIDSAPDQGTGFTTAVLLESGMSDANQDAGYIQPSKISNFVWEDLNGDGIQDGGEPGVDFTAEGISIDITLLGGAVATDLDGNSPPVVMDLGAGLYEFDNLPPGDYQVTFGEVATMWYISQQNATGAATDSDPDPTTGLADNGGAGYTLISGDNNEDVDAGYLQPASISDFVWEDANGDGLQDAGEPGIDAVEVLITDDAGGGVTDLDGNAVIMTTTAGGGLYEFLLLPPGDYILTVNSNPLPDYYLSLQDQAGAAGDAGDVSNDSDADQTTGQTHIIELESNEQEEDIDFGYFRSGTIEALVFHDSDGNGRNLTNSDAPFMGMTVQLATAAGATPVNDVFGVAIPDQISDAAGMVTFIDVPAGNYTLLYTLPAGWEFTYQDQSGFTSDIDDVDDDSDVLMGDASPAQSHIVILEGGETDNTSSVGIYKLMSIGNLVWLDSNGGDGMFDIASDGPATNVIVSLLYDQNFDGIPDEPSIATATTDAAGAYQFDDLIPGYYQVIIGSANFGPGAALVLFQNCGVGGNTTDDNDNDGSGDALLGEDVVSPIIELFCDQTSDLPGPDENLFIDFCFYFDCNNPSADLSFPICQEAEANPPICNLVLLDSYCGSMNTATSIGPQPDPLCPDGGGAHNSSWFAFVAGEAGFQMEVVPFSCTNAGMFSGIQAGVYTDCTFTDAIYCNAGCSTNAFTIGGTGTTLIPGQTYYLFLDGCAGSVCDFEVNVIQGASTFDIPNPTGLACSIPSCGPICPDGEITFTVEGLDLEIDYTWTIPVGSTLVGDGEQTGSTVITTTNEIILAFPNTGTFTVFMNSAFNGCDNTTGVQVDVDVVQPPPIDFGEYTVCEHDLTLTSVGFGNGDVDINGNVLVGPLGEPWNGDNLKNPIAPGIDINVLYVDPDGCMIDQIIDIIQIDDSPREIVEIALCESDLPFPYDQLSITGNGGGGFTNFNYTLLDTPAASGCDSTVRLTTIVLEHDMVLQSDCTASGVEISIFFEDIVPNVPDEITYDWYKDDNMNSVLDAGEEVTDNNAIPRILEIEEIGLYCVDVMLSHFVDEPGEANCMFTYCLDVTATVPDVGFDLIDEECQDSIVTITFDGTVSTAATYDWDFGNGTTATTEGPHNVMYSTPGLYYVTLSVDDNGCVANELDSIMIVERLAAPLLLTCQSTTTSITITWNEVPGATDYEVTLLSGTVGTQTTPTSWVVTGVTVSDFTEISVAATTDGACAVGNASVFSCFAQDCDEPTFTFTPTRDTICLTTDVGLDTIFLDIVNGTTPNTNSFTGPGIINEAEGVFDANIAGPGIHNIVYNYTGDDNCMFSRSITMHVFEQPIALFTTSVDTICITDAFTIEYTGGTTSAQYMWDFGIDVDMTGVGVGPFDVTYSSSGMKTITLTVVKEECISETVNIDVWVEDPLPELVIDCITDATSINYSWNDIADEYEVIIDAVSQGIQTDATWNISPLTPGTAVSIEVIAFSPNQCPNSADTENCSATNCPTLSVAITQMDSLLCIDATTSPINLSYTIDGGFMNNSGTALWSGTGVDPTTGVFNPTTAGEGSHTITLNYNEGECNAAEVSIVLTVVNQTTASFDGITTVCEGTEVILNHTGVAGAGATYMWTVNGATVMGADDQSTIVLSYDNSGMYDVTLQVSRLGCDSAPVTQSIQIDEGLLDPVIFCSSTSTSITFGWGAVDGATNYEVFIDGISMGIQTGTSYPVMGLNPNDTRTIMVIAISDNECPNSSFTDDCVAIDCPSTQIIPDEIPPTFCEGEPTFYDIDVTIMGGFMDGSDVMTFNGPSTDPVTGIVDIASLNAGEYTVYLDLSEGPCDTRDSVIITVVDLPTPSLDLLPLICETQVLTVTYTGEDIPGAVIDIVAEGNPTETDTADGSTFEWMDAGTYEVIANVTVGTCMISSETYTVVVEAELLDPVISCNPTNTSIAVSWDAVDCASMYIITVEGVAQPAQPETTFDITGLDPLTSVDITVEAISDCACGNTTMSEMCATSACEGVDIEVVNNDPDCISNLPSTVQLDVVLTGSDGSGTGSWSSASNFVTSDGIFNYDLSGVGIHEVTYTYEENDCAYIELDTVIVYDAPALMVSIVDPTCFDSDDASITFAATGGDGNYNITLSAMDVSLTDFPKSYTTDGMESDLAPGNYTISVLDGNMCMSEEMEIVISAPVQPSYSVTGPAIIAVGAFGDLVLDLGNEDADIINLSWYNETETLCDGLDCFSISVSPSVNSLYCVDITLEGGCVVTSCLPVESEFISILSISNIFSPDKNGTNDNMVIHSNNPDMVANYIRVFDRWGNLVFNVETPWQPFDDMNYPGWDGTFKGQELNPGVYVYVFEFIEEPGATPEVRVGDITIIR